MTDINFGEQEYLDLVEHILAKGHSSDDRTGVGTRSIFGHQIRFNMEDGLPLLTTKKINFNHIVTEILWILRGSDSVKFLNDHSCAIWNNWTDDEGNLGPVYPVLWTEFEGPDGKVNQIKNMQETLRTNPNSRRNYVVACHPAHVPEKAPQGCHSFFQVYVRDGVLDLQLYQRSADLMIGVPYNIASYSLLLLMLAQTAGLKPGEFIHTFGNVHIYNNHVEGAQKQLLREPSAFPTVTLNPDIKDIFSFTHKDVTLENYNPQKFIKFPIAV